MSVLQLIISTIILKYAHGDLPERQRNRSSGGGDWQLRIDSNIEIITPKYNVLYIRHDIQSIEK